MSKLEDIEKLLRDLKSKIDAHNDFKKEYNNQLAFDFSLFDFFNIGENKVSEILAYFLNENAAHGQGNIFFKEFVNKLSDFNIDIAKPKITCEKVITNNRRIDIYIELKDTVIGIENKIWADDQKNQLRDYATYMKNTGKRFLLFYLNPYGLEPSRDSIDDTFKDKLIDENQFKIISYNHDMIAVVDRWIAICEADNVSYFLKEFKKYLKIKFLGNNTLNMSNKLRELIYSNSSEIQELVSEYKSIESEIIQIINEVGQLFKKKKTYIDSTVSMGESQIFNYEGGRVFKTSLSQKNDKVWIQFYQKEIDLYSSYYCQPGSDPSFIEFFEGSELNKNIIIEKKKSKEDLLTLFLEQVKIASDLFVAYEMNKS